MTLLEVLIAMAIFTISFLVLVDSQNAIIRNSAVSERMTLATALAQEKLAEILLKYKGKSLTEIPEKEAGTFEKDHQGYRWEQSSRDFHYDLSFLSDMAQAQAGEEEASEASPLLAYLPKISDFIKRSSKEITVTVFWKQGGTERKVSITTHVFDYKANVSL